jgi:hypothetical protein
VNICSKHWYSTQLVCHEDRSNKFLSNVGTNLSNYALQSDITTTPIIDMPVTVNLLRVFNARYVYNLSQYHSTET